jgi:hypothetical protein
MEARPGTAWQPALLLNAGMVLLKHGYIARATQDFEVGWTLTRNDTRCRNGRAIGGS